MHIIIAKVGYVRSLGQGYLSPKVSQSPLSQETLKLLDMFKGHNYVIKKQNGRGEGQVALHLGYGCHVPLPFHLLTTISGSYLHL